MSAHGHTIDYSREVRQLGDLAPRLAQPALLVGLGGLGVSFALALTTLVRWDVFFRSYILNYCYILSLALGALFFVLIHHVTKAGWSVVVRRLAENVVGIFPVLALLFLPILIPIVTGNEGVYLWTSKEAVAKDTILQHKTPYLNLPFLFVRLAIYFGSWMLLSRFLVGNSVAQDSSGDPEHSRKMQYWSPVSLFLFGFTLTFFAFDILMSLNPHWFSTIFGVYFFAGSVLGFMSFLAVAIVVLQRSGRLTLSITPEHFHDIGKLSFAFVVFWTYIAFSQFMLIWYANLPEETPWFQARWETPWWRFVSMFLLVGHFVLPFFAIISRVPKRKADWLFVAACWLLFMHWVDLYYLVIPRPWGLPGLPLPEVPAPLQITDFTLLIAMLGFFVHFVTKQAASRSLIAERDPRLTESLAFENF